MVVEAVRSGYCWEIMGLVLAVLITIMVVVLGMMGDSSCCDSGGVYSNGDDGDDDALRCSLSFFGQKLRDNTLGILILIFCFIFGVFLRVFSLHEEEMMKRVRKGKTVATKTI